MGYMKIWNGGFSNRIKITLKLIKLFKMYTVLGWTEHHKNEQNWFPVFCRLLRENLSFAEIREILKKNYASVRGFSIHSIKPCLEKNGLLQESLKMMSMKSFSSPPVTARVLLTILLEDYTHECLDWNHFPFN